MSAEFGKSFSLLALTRGFSARWMFATSTVIWQPRNMVTGVLVLGFMARRFHFSGLAAKTRPEPEWKKRPPLMEPNGE